MWNSAINELFSVDTSTISYSTPNNFRILAFLALGVYFLLSGVFPISHLIYTYNTHTTISDVIILLLCPFQAIIVLSLSIPSLLVGDQIVTIGKTGTITVNDQSILLKDISAIDKNFIRHSITITNGREKIEISKFLKGAEVLILEISKIAKNTNDLGVKLGQKTRNTQNYIVVFLIMSIGMGSFCTILIPSIFQELDVLDATLTTISIYIAIILLAILCPLEFYKKYIFRPDEFIEFRLFGRRTISYSSIQKVSIDKGRSIIFVHLRNQKMKVYPTIGLSLEETYNFLASKIN